MVEHFHGPEGSLHYKCVVISNCVWCGLWAIMAAYNINVRIFHLPHTSSIITVSIIYIIYIYFEFHRLVQQSVTETTIYNK